MRFLKRDFISDISCYSSIPVVLVTQINYNPHMRKSLTTFSRLTADKFNLHKTHGDGVLSVGQISVIGTDVIIPSYIAQYNGVIVEETSPNVVSFQTKDNYICVTGIDSSESATPVVVALSSPLGVVLLERCGVAQWRSAKPLVITHGTQGRSFRRITDGTNLYLSFGAGEGEDDTKGTSKNIAIDSLDQLPFDGDIVGESVVNAGSAAFVTGWGPLKTCKNATLYEDGIDTYIQYDPDPVGVGSLQIAGVVPDLATIHAIGPEQFAYGYYLAGVPNTVIVNSWTAGNAAPDGVDVTIVLPFDPMDIELLSGSEIAAQEFGGTVIKAAFNSVGTLSNIRSTATRDVIFVNDGHLSFTDTLGDVYLDWVYVKPAFSGTSYALNNGEEIIEIDVVGGMWTAIQNGTHTYMLGSGMFAVNMMFGDYIAVCVPAGLGNGNMCLYNTSTYASTPVITLPPGITVGAFFRTDKNIGYYTGLNRVTMNFAYTSMGEIVEPVIDVQDRARHRYGRKVMHLRQEQSNDLYMYSNTELKTDVAIASQTHFGSFSSIAIFPSASTNYTIVDVDACDGDYLLLAGMNARAYACDTYPIGLRYAAIPVVTADIAADHISGDMYLDGGTHTELIVNAMNSVVIGASIALLTIEHARNVLFIGCDITAYTDIVDPANNTYKFVGCSIGGVPATSHTLLTDRSVADQHPDTAVSYAIPTFNYGNGLELVLTCDEVHKALEQLITRFTGDATWVILPTFTNYLATPTWVTGILDAQLVSLTVDVLGAALSAGEFSHRKIVATLHRDGAGNYTVLSSDSEIVYEDATFTAARLDPATYLSGISDYVEVTETGTAFSITCGAISGIARCRYSINVVINELIVVDKWPA